MATHEHRSLSQIAATIRNSGRAGQGSNPLLGFFWVTLAMVSFAGLAAFAKTSSQAGVDPLQVIFFRNAFCILFMMPLLAVRGPALARTDQFKFYAVRATLAFLSMMAWFYALAHIPLAELTSIGFLGPLFATVFSALFLGEVVRLRRISALAVGFVGAMIMLRPGSSAFGIGQARGTSKAEAKADQQRTEENAAATIAAAERKAEVVKGASDVQEDVKRMGDDDVDRELRERFTRPGGG